MDSILHILETLSAAPGPSGREAGAIETAARLMKPLADEVYRDSFGNLVGVRKAACSGVPKLMLCAHLDEVGLAITGAKDGFLSFRAVGGIDPRTLPDREVTILSEPPIVGVVAVLPPHVQQAEDMKHSIPVNKLWIDAGLTQEEAESLVGCFAVSRSVPRRLLNNCLAGKAMDDRAGFAVLLRTLELLKDCPLDTDLYILGSSREETGGAGAIAGSFGIAPQAFVAVDVTFGRTPDCTEEDTFPLGSGAIIGMGPNISRWMGRRMIDKAEAEQIPWLPEVMTGSSGTDAWGVQVARGGIATSVLSVPLRYMHNPTEVVCAEDVEYCARLLAAFVRDFAGEEGSHFAG